MRSKKTMVLIAVLLLAMQTRAQFSAGIKAGVNIAKEKYGNSFYNTSSHNFFTAGALGNYGFGKHFAAQMEINFSGEGTAEDYVSNNNKVTGVVTINRLNIPLLVQYKTPSGVYAETGPQIGLVLSAKGKYTTGSYDFKTNTQSTLFSWCVGAGYTLTKQLPGLGFNARYVPGLTHVDKGVTNAKTIKASLFSITVSYIVFRSKKK